MNRLVFDLDGTLCISVGTRYDNAIPIIDRIDKLNQLYDDGNYIIIDTARGSGSGIDYYKFTKEQLSSWGVKYHELITGIKPYADKYIDDKGYNDNDFFKD